MEEIMKQHSPSCFTVKNQNGFNKALYEYFEEDYGLTKSEIRKRVMNYPNKYPCTFIIIDVMEGGRTYIEFLNPTSFCE